MIAAALFLLVLLAVGYIAHRATVRANDLDWLYGAACTEILRVDAMRASAEADLDHEREIAAMTAKQIAVKERRAGDERVFAAIEVCQRDFIEHKATHVCAPTLDGIRGGKYTRTEGDTPVYEGMTVVPIGSKRGRR
jgi:hypothetical protein